MMRCELLCIFLFVLLTLFYKVNLLLSSVIYGISLPLTTDVVIFLYFEIIKTYRKVAKNSSESLRAYVLDVNISPAVGG